MDSVRASADEFKKYKDKSKDKYVGILMLVLAHSATYGKLRNELENDYTKGKDNYPETFDKSYNMLYHRVEEVKKTAPRREKTDKEEEGMVFSTNAYDSDLEYDDEGGQHITSKGRKKGFKQQRKTTDMSKVECYKCGKKGHYANSPECPL